MLTPELAPDEVLVASINGVFGVRGEVRLFLHDRQSRTLAKPVSVTLISPSGERRTVEISIRSGAGKRVIAKFSGDGSSYPPSLTQFKVNPAPGFLR